MHPRYIVMLLAVVAVPVSAANQLECYEEKGTMSTMCIEPKAVRVNGDTRSSPLYTGGPKGVRLTSIKMVTNCATKITTLQDNEGVNFAGGRGNETEALRSLSSWLCDVKNPKKDPKLRQF